MNSFPHGVGPVLFYTDSCPYCGDGLLPIIEYFARTDILLIVKNPSEKDIDRSPGYPALFLPKAAGPPVLLIGNGIAGILEERPEVARYHGSLNHIQNSSDRSGGAGVLRATSGSRGNTAVRVDPKLRIAAARDGVIHERLVDSRGWSDPCECDGDVHVSSETP